MANLKAHEVPGGVALFNGKDHFITLPSKVAADQVAQLVADAQASSAPADQIIFALAKALGVDVRVS